MNILATLIFYGFAFAILISFLKGACQAFSEPQEEGYHDPFYWFIMDNNTSDHDGNVDGNIDF